jgi:hypothetical protein
MLNEEKEKKEEKAWTESQFSDPEYNFYFCVRAKNTPPLA